MNDREVREALVWSIARVLCDGSDCEACALEPRPCTQSLDETHITTITSAMDARLSALEDVRDRAQEVYDARKNPPALSGALIFLGDRLRRAR